MSNTIKYPNKIQKEVALKKNKEINIKKANLGTDFETKINNTNYYYLSKNIACIYKKPTPIQVVKVDYPSRNKAKISEAYYKTPSTTDYNGIYKGYYIDFEAKCCHSTSFSFKHIFPHQINHLMTVDSMGGIAFLLIEFPIKKEIFLLEASILNEKYLASLQGERKSISYDDFKNEGFLINLGFMPEVDYLKIVDSLIAKRKK